MDKIHFFYTCFNLALGFAILLVGLGIYKPSKSEKQIRFLQRYKIFFIIGGAILFIGSVFRIIR